MNAEETYFGLVKGPRGGNWEKLWGKKVELVAGRMLRGKLKLRVEVWKRLEQGKLDCEATRNLN